MGISVLIHRWFSDHGEGWAYHSMVKTQFPIIRDALRGQASGVRGRIGPVELPALGLFLAGFRDTDPDRFADEFGRPLVVLRVAVLTHEPSQTEFDEIESRLRACQLPRKPGACDSLQIEEVPRIHPPVSLPPGSDALVTTTTNEPAVSESNLGEKEDLRKRPVLTSGKIMTVGFVALFMSLVIAFLSRWEIAKAYLSSRKNNAVAVVASPSEQTILQQARHGKQVAQQEKQAKDDQLTPKRLEDIEDHFHKAVDDNSVSALFAFDSLTRNVDGFEHFVRIRSIEVATYLTNRLTKSLVLRNDEFIDASYDRARLSEDLRNDRDNIQKLKERFLNLAGQEGKNMPAEQKFSSIISRYISLEDQLQTDLVKIAYANMAKQFERTKAAIQADRRANAIKEHEFGGERELLANELSELQIAIQAYTESWRPGHPLGNRGERDAALKKVRKLNSEVDRVNKWVNALSSPETWVFRIRLPPTCHVVSAAFIRETRGNASEVSLESKDNRETYQFPPSPNVNLFYSKSLPFVVKIMNGDGMISTHRFAWDLRETNAVDKEGVGFVCENIAFFKLPEITELLQLDPN